MKINFIVLLILFSFCMDAQEKINVDLSIGAIGIDFSGAKRANIIYQSEFDIGLLYGVGISAFISDLIYMRTEFGRINHNKVVEIEVPTGIVFDEIRFTENFVAFGGGIRLPNYGFYFETEIGAIVVAKQEFDFQEEVLSSNYFVGVITIGWKRAYLGVKDNFGIVVNAKFMRTFNAMFDAPNAYLNQDIISLNIGLHYVLRS